MNRDEAIEAITQRTGNTPKQAAAFLDVLHSGLVRRGHFDGEVLSDEEIAERVDTWIEDSEQ